MTKPKIYWLVSYPKSGNTWCRIFLSNYRKNSNEPVSINELKDIPLISARYFIDSMLGIDSSELTPEEITDFRLEAFKIFCNNINKTVILKVHDVFPEPGEPNFFSDENTAGVIYIVRNPLDVAVSLSNHLGQSIDSSIQNMNNNDFYFANSTDKFETQFPQKLKSWSTHVNSWLNNYNGKLLLVRYEDLIHTPCNTFKEIIAFLGLEFEKERLEKAIKFSSFDILKEDEANNGFREKSSTSDTFFREGKAGTWKKYLNTGQENKIITHHHDVMQKLNYLTEDNTVLI